MKIYTIKQKTSNSGSIHDLASSDFDRVIKFKGDTQYAVVLASYYGGKGYTTHEDAQSAIKMSHKNADYSHEIIDVNGTCYDNDSEDLIPDFDREV